MYRDTTNVEPEMCDYINKNWNHWNSNEKLKEKFGSLPGKHSIDSLQKTVILGTWHIIRKVLQCEAWSLNGGDHRCFKRSARKKRPVTRDIPIYNNNMLNKFFGRHIYWNCYVLAVLNAVIHDKNERLGGLSLETIDRTTLFTSQSIWTARGLNSVTNHFSCCTFFRRHFCMLNQIQQVCLPVICSCCTWFFSCLDSKYILRIKRHYEGTQKNWREKNPHQCNARGEVKWRHFQ